MRKGLIRRLFAFSLALMMLVAVVGCGDNGTAGNSSDFLAGDDFFADDTEVDIGDDTSSGNLTTSSDAGSNPITTNKSEGKSWADVLKSMPSSLRGTTVTIYNWNPVSEYTGSSAVISKFEKETGIKVKWITQSYNTYLSNLASRVAAGESPDVVRTMTPSPMGLISLQPLTAAKYDFSDKAWDQVTMKDYTYGGKVYATSLKNTHLGSADIVMYNKALISKYDLEDPYVLWKNGKWTWDKLIEISEIYLKESKAEFAMGGGEYAEIANLWGIQGPVAYKNGKFVNITGDKTFLDVTEKIAELANTDNIYSGWQVDAFNDGECLFWLNGSIYARKNNARFQTLKTSGQMNVVPCPSIPGQSTYYQGMSEYEAYGIADGAKNPEAVPYLLRYFLDAENYDMNSVFCSSQALEVYNWAMSQENRVWPTFYQNQSYYFGGKDDVFSTDHTKQTKDQIISFVKSNSAVIDARVEQYNKAVSKLG